MPRKRRQRECGVWTERSRAVVDAVLSNADLCTHIVTSLSSGHYLDQDREMAWYMRRRKARKHLVHLSKLCRVNVVFRDLCRFRIAAVVEAFDASRVRFCLAVNQHPLGAGTVPYTRTIHEEPFLALVAPIKPPTHLEDKAQTLSKLTTLYEATTHAPVTSVRMLDALLTPRCLCCRVDLHERPPSRPSLECPGCKLEPADPSRWEHCVRFPDCAWLLHPYELSGDTPDRLDPLSPFACRPLPYTSDQHLVSMIIIRTSNGWEEGSGFEKIEHKARVQMYGNGTFPPRVGTYDEQVVSVISTMRASGRLAPALERVCRLRYEALQRFHKEDERTLAMFQKEWNSGFSFRVELPPHRLLHGGLGIEDCSMAELFGLTDAEFDAYKLLGRDLTKAKREDYILKADDWRRAYLETCLQKIEVSGKGGSVWTLDAAADRLPRDTFTTSETGTEKDKDVPLNMDWFCTWRPGAFLTFPIMTAAAARKARLVEKALAVGPEESGELSQSLQAGLRHFSHDHMLQHFDRVDQIAGLLTSRYKISDEAMRVVIQMVDSAITLTPQKGVAPMAMWDGQLREHSSTFVHGDLVLRHLLYNVVHCNRMRVEVTHTMASASYHLECDPDTKLRATAFENAVVRLSISTGMENSVMDTYHRVRLLGCMSAKAFLELIHKIPAYASSPGAGKKPGAPDLWAMDVLTSPKRLIELSLLQAMLSNRAADLSAFFNRRPHMALRFLQLLLAHDRWMTFSSPATRVGTRELLYRNAAYWQPECKPLCEFLKLPRCLCNQRCTFSGRRANQCVFGPSTKRLAQNTLAFPRGKSAAADEKDESGEDESGEGSGEESQVSEESSSDDEPAQPLD